MTSGTQVVLNADSEKAGRFDRADRYLDRVAALSPADWGRLDAAGQHLVVSDPTAVWRRTRRATTMGLVPPAWEGVMAIADFAAELVGRVAHALAGDDRFGRTLARGDDVPRDADAERMYAQFQRVHEIARAQPGGARDAVRAIAEGLHALHTRHLRTPKSFRRAYAPMEPVIPAASL